jgi:hypothetical protein
MTRTGRTGAQLAGLLSRSSWPASYTGVRERIPHLGAPIHRVTPDRCLQLARQIRSSETRTSTCRNFATISSGLYRFLGIAVLLDVRDLPQVGPVQWGWIKELKAKSNQIAPRRALHNAEAIQVSSLKLRPPMGSKGSHPASYRSLLDGAATRLVIHK